MKVSRRTFVKTGTIVAGGIITNQFTPAGIAGRQNSPIESPITISTWENTIKSTELTIRQLLNGNSSLDAVEAGIRVAEDDPTNNTVGYGGLPDEDGIVTLDASVMDWNGNAGSVAAIEKIRNPVSVAKLVMLRTKHVMLAGDGAKKFALENGFKEENLLTEESRKAWLTWKSKNPHGTNRTDIKNHDTIGMLAIDADGNMSGGVSTSGLAFKIHGRVGDSPIIGAAMFVDNNVGGAVATGNGEFVMKTLGSFLIVEKMREGFSPQKACEFAIERIKKISKNDTNIQIGYLALSKDGELGAFSLKKGFSYCLANQKSNKSFSSGFLPE